MALAGLVVLFVLKSVGLVQGGYDLDLQGFAFSSREPCLVKGFLALRRGRVFDPSALEVRDGAGDPCPFDMKATSRHNDGSIRYLSIQAVVPSRLVQGKLRLREVRGGRTPPRSIRARALCGVGAEVDTGLIRVLCEGDSPSLITRLEDKGGAAFFTDRGVELKVRLNGRLFCSSPPREVSLLGGRSAASILVEGKTRSRDGDEGPAYALTLRFFQGSAHAACGLVVRGGAFEGRCDGIELCMEPEWDPDGFPVRLFGGPDVKSFRMDPAQEADLQARRHGLILVRGEEEEALGRWHYLEAAVQYRKMGFSLALPECCALHPWGLEIDPVRGCLLSLFSHSFEWLPDLDLQREFDLFFSRKKIGPCAGSLGRTLCGASAVGLSPRLGERIFPFSTPSKRLFSEPLYGLYLDVVKDLRERLGREWAQWDGFRDYGDYRTDFGLFANCEFDPVYGLLKCFLLSGRPEDLAAAEIMQRHWMRFDRTPSRTRDHGAGLPWVHGTDHASGKIEAGHMWVDGSLLLGLITGDEQHLEAAKTIGKFMAAPACDELERCAAWRLMALTALVDTGHGGFEKAMNRVADWMRDRQREAGYFAFLESHDETGAYFPVNTWVTAGITMEALYRHYLITSDERSRESLTRAAVWLMNHARDPVAGRWYQQILYPVEAPDRWTRRQGTVEGEEAAFLALGLARAGQVSRDPVLAALAGALLRDALDEVKANPPAYPGKALAMIARSAPDALLAVVKTKYPSE